MKKTIIIIILLVIIALGGGFVYYKKVIEKPVPDAARNERFGGTKLDPETVYKMSVAAIDKINKEFNFVSDPIQNHVSPELLFAIAMTESSGYSEAKTDFAFGLSGLSEFALKDLKEYYSKYNINIKYEELARPEVSLYASALYLRFLKFSWLRNEPDIDEFTMRKLILVSYVWGIGNTKKWLGETETSNDSVSFNIPKDAKTYDTNVTWWTYYAVKNLKGK